MISWMPYECKACGNFRFQRTIFMGMEFQYECPCCTAVCLFSESIHYRFQENFESPHYNKYIATIRDGEVIDGRPNDVVRKFISLNQDAPPRPLDINVEVLSDKPRSGKFFIASAAYDHFQDALRGVVRMRDHVLNRKGKQTYNILIAPKHYELYFTPRSKLAGVDELWSFDFRKNYRWPFINTASDIADSNSFCSAVTKRLDELEGLGETISKRPGPLPQGSSVIREIIDPGNTPVYLADGSEAKGKYMAILVRSATKGRTGFNNYPAIQQAIHLIRKEGFSPLVVTTTRTERKIAAAISSRSVFNASSLRDQTAFYKNHCLAVVGTNGSGCNFPAAYGIPIFALAKDFAYPYDFYCMGKLTSTYDPSKSFGGGREKPDNVVEIKLEREDPTSLGNHEKAFREWIRDYVR